MTATPGGQVIERFYAAFDARDGDAMAGCYAPGARFGDPVFPDLRDGEIADMWRMLVGTPGSDLRVELREHDASGDAGTARWVAHYTFSRTGRAVVNDVRATFRFSDGLIAEHRDAFGFHRWARQALGPAGLLLGWTPVVQGKVRAQAARSLQEFRGTP
jgi:ketosteroid isomerase-like protein